MFVATVNLAGQDFMAGGLSEEEALRVLVAKWQEFAERSGYLDVGLIYEWVGEIVVWEISEGECLIYGTSEGVSNPESLPKIDEAGAPKL